MLATLFNSEGPRRQFPLPLQVDLDACRGGFQPISRLQGAPCLRWHQLSAQRVQIGQCKGHLRAGQVLGNTAVTDLAEAPQLLDDAKRMFAPCSGTRATAIYPFLIVRQLLTRLGAAVDPVAYAGLFGAIAMKIAPGG